jgi:cytochrome b involved in lipid metabolism
MDKKIIIFSSILVIILIVGFVIFSSQKNLPSSDGTINTNPSINPSNNEESSATQEAETEEETTNAYTLEQIAEHNNEESCWVSTKGIVYDITEFLPKHKEILKSYCGQVGEFESAFFNQHGNSKESVIKEFEI